MKNNEPEQDSLPQRLCSEIQLFDLCDLSSCRFKSGRYCGNSDLLERFEKISDEEVRSPEQYVDEELEECDEACADDYDECEDGEEDEGKDWDD